MAHINQINQMAGAFGRMSGAAPELALLTIQSIAVGHRFEFHANGVGDGDDGSSLSLRRYFPLSSASGSVRQLNLRGGHYLCSIQ